MPETRAFKGTTITIVDEEFVPKAGIGRISNVTGTIEVTKDFLQLEKPQQDFLITHLLILYAKRSDGDFSRKYLEADIEALHFMMNRYPEVTKSYWYETFLKLILGFQSELNMQRTESMHKMTQ